MIFGWIPGKDEPPWNWIVDGLDLQQYLRAIIPGKSQVG